MLLIYFTEIYMNKNYDVRELRLAIFLLIVMFLFGIKEIMYL